MSVEVFEELLKEIDSMSADEYWCLYREAVSDGGCDE